jgi:hypothetical protein
MVRRCGVRSQYMYIDFSKALFWHIFGAIQPLSGALDDESTVALLGIIVRQTSSHHFNDHSIPTNHRCFVIMKRVEMVS